MKLRKLLTCLPLLGMMAFPAAADDDDDRRKEHRRSGKDAVEWRDRSERQRYGYRSDPYSWSRETRGHRPHDDGVVSRNEWAGI